MRNQTARIIMHAKRSKTRIHTNKDALQRLLKNPHLMTGRQARRRRRNGWYQQRKRAADRLRNLSNGQIQLLENGYRGEHRRHWLRDSRCEHVFLASPKEVSSLGADRICPFCHIPNDLRRCGSVDAVQEIVLSRSRGDIEFLSENELRGPDDQYQFACTIHSFRLETSYRKFLEAPRGICFACSFDDPGRSSSGN